MGKKNKVLVISFDGISDSEFENMAEDTQTYPNVARFMKESSYTKNVSSIFMSNTYPIHTSIATGKLPKDHGIISNYLLDNANSEYQWAQMSKYIKTKTIWDAAREKGLKTAAILWPVTGGAKINYNLPEIHLTKGQNRVLKQLQYGSKLFQINALLKYRHKLKGIKQPYLDDFATDVASDVLRGKKADLTLVHLIAYDDIRHRVGGASSELNIAKSAIDENLGKLLDITGEDITVIVFSDHAHIDVKEVVNLNKIFGKDVFEQCGGSAFFAKKIENLEEYPWFGRNLTENEMIESGYATKVDLGIAAKIGYCFAESGAYKSNHGYPTDYDNYKVFYAIRGKDFVPTVKNGGNVRDITAIINGELGLIYS